MDGNFQAARNSFLTKLEQGLGYLEPKDLQVDANNG